MIKRSLIALLLALIIIVPAVACGPAAGGGGSTTIAVTYEQFQKDKNIVQDISVPAGQVITLQLFSNATTGYSWKENAQISEPAVLSQLSHSYVAPSDTGGRVGAGGIEVWTFKALKAGKSTVSEEYGQPWSGGEKGAWTFKLNVTVQ